MQKPSVLSCIHDLALLNYAVSKSMQNFIFPYYLQPLLRGPLEIRSTQSFDAILTTIIRNVFNLFLCKLYRSYPIYFPTIINILFYVTNYTNIHAYILTKL